MRTIRLIPGLLFLSALFCFYEASAQQKVKHQQLSVREREKNRMHSRDSLLRAYNQTDTSITGLLQQIERYTATFNQINNNLSEGLDTAEVSAGLPTTVRRIVKIDSLINTHKSSTLRYLFVLRDNLDHVQDKLSGWQSDLENVSSKLIQNQNELVKFTKDTSLRIVPYDSLIRKAFFAQRRKTRRLFRRTDSLNRANLLKINLLQDKITVAYTDALDATDQIDLKIKRFAIKAISGESGNILDTPLQFASFKTALQGTIRINSLLYGLFIKSETVIQHISFFFFLITLSWIFLAKRSILRKHENPGAALSQANYISRNPLVSALLVSVAIIPYFYDHPPVVFIETLFLASMVLSLILIKRHFLTETFKFLCGLFLLSIIYGASNLFVQITNIDRLVILFLSIVSIISGTIIYKSARKDSADHLPHTCTALQIFIGLHILSLVLNLSGRFSLAKIIGVTAVFNLWFLIILFFVVQIIMQALFLQFQVKKDSKSFIKFIDYTELQKKIRRFLITLATLLWLFFLLQNLNIDDWAADTLGDMLTKPRTVGGSSFTFGNFVVFILVIWLSSVLSRIISYFYDISSQSELDFSAARKRNRTSALLIRLGVFSVGFLLAVAASGFPLEKLTIIISAFGVGIGFGLQNIVNNLVSGIILAFEKPIQIGDFIEVDNREGVMKEIGIRSSKILTNDGSEVIIPNGDLISQHVTNWTLSNNNRRIELIVGVAYGSDIGKVEALLTGVLTAHPDVMQTPSPAVFVHNFNDSSVDFRLFFWVADNNKRHELKSKVMNAVYAEFVKEGIEIPFPQRDVHLFLPDNLKVTGSDAKGDQAPDQ
ncbi:MAG TPA: mechanosensitive ion channel domain-containing protein [Mucilaginibacter sp.]|nr:mechanosensitive ion channel domain-containing protein [Mucilaginibacter sp.]